VVLRKGLRQKERIDLNMAQLSKLLKNILKKETRLPKVNKNELTKTNHHLLYFTQKYLYDF